MADNNNLNIIVKVVDQATKKLQDIDKLVKKLGATSNDTAEKTKKLSLKHLKKVDDASLRRSIVAQDVETQKRAKDRVSAELAGQANLQKHQKLIDAQKYSAWEAEKKAQEQLDRQVLSFKTRMNNQEVSEYNKKIEDRKKQIRKNIEQLKSDNEKVLKNDIKNLKLEAKEKQKQYKQDQKLQQKINTSNQKAVSENYKEQAKSIEQRKKQERIEKLKSNILSDQTLKLQNYHKVKIKYLKSESSLENFSAKRKHDLELKESKKIAKEQKQKEPASGIKKADVDFTQFNKTLFTTTAFIGTFYKLFGALTSKLEEGANLDRLQKQFQRVFGTQGIAQDISKFTTTAVDNMVGMQAALDMGNAGIVRNQEEAADIIAKAATAAKMANIDTATGIKEVTEALKSGSLANLEHLNILRTNDPVLKQHMKMLEKYTGIMSPSIIAQEKFNIIRAALTRHTKDQMFAEMDLMDIVTKVTSSFKTLSGTIGIFAGKAVTPLVFKVEELVNQFNSLLTRLSKDKSVVEFTKNLIVVGSVVTGVIATLGTLRLGMMLFGGLGLGAFGSIATVAVGIAVALKDLKDPINDISRLIKVLGAGFSGTIQLVSSFLLNSENYAKGVGKMDKKTADFLRNVKIGDKNLLDIVTTIARVTSVTLKFISDVIDKIRAGINVLLEHPLFKNLGASLFGDSQTWSRDWLDETNTVRDSLVSAAGVVAAAWALDKILPDFTGKGLLTGAALLGGGAMAAFSAFGNQKEKSASKGEKLSREDLIGFEGIGQQGLEQQIVEKQKQLALVQSGQNFNPILNFLAKFDSDTKKMQEDMASSMIKDLEILTEQLNQSKAIEKNLRTLIKMDENVISAIEKINQPVTTTSLTGTDAITKIEGGQLETVPGGVWDEGRVKLAKMPDYIPPSATTTEYEQMMRTSEKYANEKQKTIMENAFKAAMIDNQLSAEELYNIYREAINASDLTKNTKPKPDLKNKTRC